MAMNINSLFSATKYSYLFSNNSTTKNSNQSASQNSVNSLWSNYASSSSNAMNALAGLTEIKSGVSSVLESYDNAKDAFYSEFDDAMSALGKSAKNVKNYDFAAVTGAEDAKEAITKTTTTDEDGNAVTKTEYSDAMKDALKAVQGFVDDYNSAKNFLSDNSSVSGRVGRLANNFSQIMSLSE